MGQQHPCLAHSCWGEQALSVPGGSCKNLSPPCTLAAFYRGFAKEGNNIYLSGNRGKLVGEEILGMSQQQTRIKGMTGMQPSNLQLFWDPWHSESHRWIVNTPSIFLFTQKCAKMDNSLFWPATFSPVSSLEKGSCGLYPAFSNSKDRCCCDVAVMLPENTVLPKTFHPTDELTAQWKTIGPERDLSQPWISSAQDIIKVKQGLLARCISGLSLY